MLGDLIVKNLKPAGHNSRIIKSQTFMFFSYVLKTSPTQILNEISRVARCDSFAVLLSHYILKKKSKITARRRSLAYRLRKMGPLSLSPPPVQGSRSIWRSGISLRSCSCCSIGVQQLPHRFPLSHELKEQNQLRKTIPSTLHELSPKSVTLTNSE